MFLTTKCWFVVVIVSFVLFLVLVLQMRVSTAKCWFVVVIVSLLCVFFYFHRCVFLQLNGGSWL